MHLRDLKLAAGAAVKLSVRAVDAAGNLGPAATADITVSSRVPAALPRPGDGHELRPPSAATATPAVAWDRSRSPSSTSSTRSTPSPAS